MNNYLGKASFCAVRGPAVGPGILALVISGLILAGCAQPPERRFADLARQHSLQTGVVAAGEFRLRYYGKALAVAEKRIDVYLEGDGTPWSSKTRIAPDPTSRQAIGLRLMIRAPAPALYLARPCYHELQGQPPCAPGLWTRRRYSESVVAAMAQGLSELLAAKAPEASVRLLGYSGGGVLAMLLAERLARVTAVITVAANLDIVAWTRLHEYTALAGSLNPAARRPLPRRVHQIHLAGSDDDNVPAGLIRGAVERQARAAVYVIGGFDHSCCWRQHWPELHNALDEGGDLCRALAASSSRLACRTLRSVDGG